MDGEMGGAMHQWHIAVYAGITVLAVTAFVTECALCRRETRRRSVDPHRRGR
jgi:hypothetical protein